MIYSDGSGAVLMTVQVPTGLSSKAWAALESVRKKLSGCSFSDSPKIVTVILTVRVLPAGIVIVPDVGE